MDEMMSEYSLDVTTKSVVRVSNGEQYHISCYDDLAPYYAYLSGKFGHDAAQKMLKNVFNGEKVMSELIERTQRGY